jgi:UDP-xylose/UDP-N-acetylglucosamine transporter B4
MLMGIMILNKSYDVWKYVSVVLITIGIFISTIASGNDVKKELASIDDNSESSFLWYIFGVILMTISLFISARMGLYQETMYKKRGKHATEALFYTHILPLPAFLLLSTNIWSHFVIATQSDDVNIPLVNIAIKTQILYLIINFLAHYMCISCVYTLTSECSSLTVTLVVTLRKFVSLIFSIIYFNHPFTFYHWLGTVLLIFGTVMFTEILPKTRNLIFPKNSYHVLQNDVEKSNYIDDEDRLPFYWKFFSQSKQKIKSIAIAKPHVNYKILNHS